MEEELQTIQPQIDEAQQAQDLEVMEQTPDISEDVAQSEPLAGLSSQLIGETAKRIRKGLGVSDIDKYKNMADKYNFETPIHVQKQKLKQKEAMQKLEAEVKAEKEKKQLIVAEDTGETKDALSYDMSADTDSYLVGEPRKTADSMLKDTALDPTNSWEMNYNTLAETNDIKVLIANQANEIKLDVDEARRGVITDEALTVMSRLIGEDADSIAKVLGRKEGEVLSPEYVLASKNLLTSSAKRLYDLALKVKAGNASKTDELALLKQQYFHKELYKSFMGMRAEYGRGLRAFGIKQGSEAFETEQISEAMFHAKFGQNPEQVAELIASTDGNMKRIGDAVKGSMFEVFMNKGLDAIHAYRIGSVLSGASTQIVNFTSNMFNLGLHQVDLLNAGILGAFNRSDVMFDKITVTDAKASMFALMNSIHDSLGVAWKSMKTGEEYGLGGKIEDITHDDALKAENLFGVSKPNTVTKAWDGAMGIHQFMVKNVMSSTDSFAKKLTEQQEMYRLAFIRAENIASQENLSKEEAQQLLQYMIENPSEDMIREATENAKRVTFQESNPHIDEGMQKFLGNRFVRNIVMFRKTPTNILRQAFIDRNPAMAVLSKKFRDDFVAGGSRRQLALGRIATGAEIAGMGYMMVANDMVTGAAPKDPKEREAWEQAGKKPYSIKLGGKWVSYEKLEPAGNIIGVIATLAQASNRASMYQLDDEDTDAEDRLNASLIMALASQTLDKSMMTGLRDFLGAFESPAKAEHLKKSLVASFVPVSGMQRNMKYLLESDVRTSDSVWEYIKAQTPYDFESLEVKRDFYGNSYKREQYANPVKVYDQMTQKDVVLQESDRLLASTGKTFFKMPSIEKHGHKLKARTYNQYVELSRKNLEVEEDGKWVDFKSYLKIILKDPEYKKASPETRLNIISGKISEWDNMAYKIFIRDREKLKNRFTLDLTKDKIYQDSFDENITLKESKERNMEIYKKEVEEDYNNDVIFEQNSSWRIKQ